MTHEVLNIVPGVTTALAFSGFGLIVIKNAFFAKNGEKNKNPKNKLQGVIPEKGSGSNRLGKNKLLPPCKRNGNRLNESNPNYN